MALNATRYGFLGAGNERNETLEFWKSPNAKVALTAFLEDALGGRLEPSHMSELPPDLMSNETWPPPIGMVRKLVGRRCRNTVEHSETEALVEGYDEWRRDHKRRTRQLDILTPLLAPYNITVYRLDMGYNECPSDVLPILSAGYSGYWLVPPRAKERGKGTQRLKKLDPPFDRVIQFVAKHSKAKLDAASILSEFETILLSQERVEASKEWAAKWGKSVTLAIGLVGALIFVGLRMRAQRKGQRDAPSSPDTPPVATAAPASTAASPHLKEASAAAPEN